MAVSVDNGDTICAGVTRSGTPCNRKAVPGEWYCTVHKRMNETRAKRAARTKAKNKKREEEQRQREERQQLEVSLFVPSGDDLEREYLEIAGLCKNALCTVEMKPASAAQWMRIWLEAIKLHKEEERMNMEGGQGFEFNLTIVEPPPVATLVVETSADAIGLPTPGKNGNGNGTSH